MTCTISSSIETLQYTDVLSVYLPGDSGYLELLPGHAEIYANLVRGEMSIKLPATTVKKSIDETAVCHMANDSVVIMI